MTTVLTANGHPFDPEAVFKALDFYEELGDWHIIDVTLASAKCRSISSCGIQVLESRLAEWRTKLDAAMTHERADGWGSLIKWNHPFNVQHRQQIEDMLTVRRSLLT